MAPGHLPFFIVLLDLIPVGDSAVLRINDMQIYAASWVVPISAPPIAGGGVAVEDGRIMAVAPLDWIRREFSAPLREFPGCVLLPGLVNAHTHLELTHYPSWRIRKDLDYTPRTFTDWVIQVIKIKRGLKRQEKELSLREGLRITLESGTTAIGEIVTDRELLPGYGRIPLAGRLFLEAIGQDPALWPELLHSLEAALGSLALPALLPALAPHAPYTLADELFRGVADLAARQGVPLAVHLAESPEEAEFLHDSTGRIAEQLYPFVHWESYLPPPRRTTPAAFLDSLGILGPGTLAVHCVHITPADAELLQQRGVTAVLCPRSNDKLDVGTAPVHLLKNKGIPLALGTDSLASNDSLSLWDELRFLLELFPDDFSHAEALRLATLDGAEALRIADLAGSLEAGKRADFQVLELDGPYAESDLCRAIIERGRLREVFLAGEPAAGYLVARQDK